MSKIKSDSQLFDPYKTKYTININPMKQTYSPVSEENKEKLGFLKTISSLPSLLELESQRLKGGKSVRFKDLRELREAASDAENKKAFASLEEKIWVDGEVFLKKDIDQVAKKILHKCNYIPEISTKFKKEK